MATFLRIADIKPAYEEDGNLAAGYRVSRTYHINLEHVVSVEQAVIKDEREEAEEPVTPIVIFTMVDGTVFRAFRSVWKAGDMR